MSLDRQMVDTIKAHHARRSTTQLELIARGGRTDHWSPEAVEAAREVLGDRRAGIATEPTHPEDDHPPEFTYDPEEVAAGLLFGLVTGYVVIPYYRRVELPDLPIPFGPSMAWVAMETTDTRAAATALGLRQPTPASWDDGMAAAHRGAVFVTPPLGDWTLAVGTPLFLPPDGMASAARTLLVKVGRSCPDAQYFCNHPDIGLFAWGRAVSGRLVRGYGWLGAQGRTLWDEGAPTPEEIDLGLLFTPGQPPRTEADDGGAVQPISVDGLLQLASCWSIDPSTLDQEFMEPVSGLVGSLPR